MPLSISFSSSFCLFKIHRNPTKELLRTLQVAIYQLSGCQMRRKQMTGDEEAFLEPHPYPKIFPKNRKTRKITPAFYFTAIHFPCFCHQISQVRHKHGDDGKLLYNNCLLFSHSIQAWPEESAKHQCLQFEMLHYNYSCWTWNVAHLEEYQPYVPKALGLIPSTAQIRCGSTPKFLLEDQKFKSW